MAKNMMIYLTAFHIRHLVKFGYKDQVWTLSDGFEALGERDKVFDAEALGA